MIVPNSSSHLLNLREWGRLLAKRTPMTLFYFDVTDGRETSRDILENDVGTVEITIREQDHGPALFSVVWASVAEARES
jgi:hypothetical protein